MRLGNSTSAGTHNFQFDDHNVATKVCHGDVSMPSVMIGQSFWLPGGRET